MVVTHAGVFCLSSRRRHTRCLSDWSSDVCSSDLDSSSANYRQWLTPEQFGDQFGAAPEDIDTITGWLGSQGFRVDRVSNGRGVIEFSGTAGEVERALHTQIHSYLVHGEQHWANSQEPRIPAALSPAVAGIVSLHNFTSSAMRHGSRSEEHTSEL